MQTLNHLLFLKRPHSENNTITFTLVALKIHDGESYWIRRGIGNYGDIGTGPHQFLVDKFTLFQNWRQITPTA